MRRIPILFGNFLAIAAIGHAETTDSTSWKFKQEFLPSLAQSVSRILKTQDRTSGRFGAGVWIPGDQSVIYPLAAAWALKDPGNRWYHDPKLLEAIMRGGDVLILCSDGLHGLVSDHELSAAVSRPDLDQACDSLVDLAKQRGGHDNITVILARADTNPELEPLSTTSAERFSRSRSNPSFAMLIIAGIMLLLLALGALGWLVVRMNRGSHSPGAERATRPTTRAT